MQEWILAFAAITAFSATGFVVVAVLWLRRLRSTVSLALAEAANQQVRSAQRLSESLARLQKQQRAYEQQLHLLAQANTQLRQGLVNVATRLDHTRQSDTMGENQTIH